MGAEMGSMDMSRQQFVDQFVDRDQLSVRLKITSGSAGVA